jgi:RNA recognition motif-containing protein
MEVKLFVGNLSFQTTADTLRTLFAEAGTVNNVELIKDRDTGQSKGFAFITMNSQADAQNAITMCNGKTIDDRELKVNTAKAREDRPRGGGGGGGGYRGGGGGGGGGGGYRDHHSGNRGF